MEAVVVSDEVAVVSGSISVVSDEVIEVSAVMAVVGAAELSIASVISVEVSAEAILADMSSDLFITTLSVLPPCMGVILPQPSMTQAAAAIMAVKAIIFRYFFILHPLPHHSI